eukprot:TRINITY_DN2159_c0_g1_i1.p1 TRINITY_DN2159_c0_g1~~TRINITY_DN2159_c0_g1_i1.p1  ORF type:complete len:637 (-),score=126.31 TRINITY_DN2159_c0_g1_i1:264-2174(-)
MEQGSKKRGKARSDALGAASSADAKRGGRGKGCSSAGVLRHSRGTAKLQAKLQGKKNKQIHLHRQSQPAPSSANGDEGSPETLHQQVTATFSVCTPQRVGENLAPAGTRPDCFSLQTRLADGSFGALYRTKHLATGFECVARVLPKYSKEVEEEVEVLRKCKASHVVSYFGALRKEESLWILMEYCELGSLLDIMRTCNCTLSENEIEAVIEGVLFGLLVLHREKISHQDVKASNILMDDKMCVKLTDFGIADCLTRTTYVPKHIFRPWWTAPELARNIRTTKADIWSLGITAIELAEGRPPRSDRTEAHFFEELLFSEPPTLTDSRKFSPQFSSFIASCLVKDPDSRPTVNDLLQHPFILRNLGQGHKVLHPLVEKYISCKSVNKGGCSHARSGSEPSPQLLRFAAAMATGGSGGSGGSSGDSGASAASSTFVYTPEESRPGVKSDNCDTRLSARVRSKSIDSTVDTSATFNSCATFVHTSMREMQPIVVEEVPSETQHEERAYRGEEASPATPLSPPLSPPPSPDVLVTPLVLHDELRRFSDALFRDIDAAFEARQVRRCKALANRHHRCGCRTVWRSRTTTSRESCKHACGRRHGKRCRAVSLRTTSTQQSPYQQHHQTSAALRRRLSDWSGA